MIGNHYWATGITVRYGYSGANLYGWGAEVRFYDDGFAGDDNADTGEVVTEGVLKTRYKVHDGNGPDADGLSAAVDAVKRDAEKLGIRWRDEAEAGLEPAVYYQGGGEDEDYPPPDGWRGMVNAQAERLGWRPLYAAEEQGQ